jgi:ankyrin repeat protein
MLLLQGGATALHQAADQGHKEVMELLLGAGAAVDAAYEVSRYPGHNWCWDSTWEGAGRVMLHDQLVGDHVAAASHDNPPITFM